MRSKFKCLWLAIATLKSENRNVINESSLLISWSMYWRKEEYRNRYLHHYLFGCCCQNHCQYCAINNRSTNVTDVAAMSLTGATIVFVNCLEDSCTKMTFPGYIRSGKKITANYLAFSRLSEWVCIIEQVPSNSLEFDSIGPSSHYDKNW